MTASPTPAYHWHHLYDVNGGPYPTRRRFTPAIHQRYVDGELLNPRLLGLTPEQNRHMTAGHETTHACLYMAGGIHVYSVCATHRPTGDEGGHVATDLIPPYSSLGYAWAMGAVAGERADDRWLRETGLWSNDLATMTELCANHDRKLMVENITPTPTFGTGGDLDYAHLHELADEALKPYWRQIMRAIPTVLNAGEITGDHLADVLGISNPAPLPVQIAQETPSADAAASDRIAGKTREQ